ncbi:MAG TPA: mechanosensitive ion channel family protein [Candidatus Udaeobacter sp.]|jgi:small conductance mechanosensitive channel|nr:mechanosensitive ion channel family protein [Candidatus Udaeobacter sp.]
MILAVHVSSVLPAPDVLADMGWRIAITIVIAFIVQRLLFLLWGRLAALMIRAAHDQHEAVQRATTLKHILRHLTTVVVALAVLIRSLDVLGWDVKPLLAGAGILGVALGFGAQTLVRDWIAGIFILVENQFSVGDTVEIDKRPAVVEALTVRSTTLRDFNGYLHFVPNGEMKVVTNRSRGWNRLAVDVPVRAGQDLDRALQRCRAIAEEMNGDPTWKERLLEPIHVWGIERLGADAVVIRLVVRGRPGGDVAEAARELRRRVHDALAEAGVQYPSAAAAAAAAEHHDAAI